MSTSKSLKLSKRKKVLLLEEFYNEHGREPKVAEEYKGEKLGRFLSHVRQDSVKLTNEEQELLENLGIRITRK